MGGGSPGGVLRVGFVGREGAVRGVSIDWERGRGGLGGEIWQPARQREINAPLVRVIAKVPLDSLEIASSAHSWILVSKRLKMEASKPNIKL